MMVKIRRTSIKQESADNRVLHRAGSKNQPTIIPYFSQEARNNHSLFLAYLTRKGVLL
ncbi:hypothetical protein SJDPG2_03590 [Porphyromonas gingivalis SJD2]|nr:hypothetical protein SJDPG2_03590 [Porphyromonas gingivalis SJD2]